MKTQVFDIPIVNPELDYYQRNEVSNSDLGWLHDELYPKDKFIDPTSAYRFGNLFDAMVTESWRINYSSRKCDNEVFLPEEFDLADEMRKAFLKDDTCRMMADNSTPQAIFIKKVLFQLDNGFEYSLNMRCKFDLWMDAFGWGGDLKSTTATTYEQFLAAIKHFNYDRQRAVYMTLAGSDQDMLIGVSKKNLKVFKVPIKKGDALYNSGMQKMEDLTFKYWQLFGDAA